MTMMAPRTSRESVTFARPFSLRGVDGVQPAGTYVVETEEEPVESLSFPADPPELRAARTRDAEGGRRPPRGWWPSRPP